MGGMMGSPGSWALLWGLLALVLVAAGGSLASWALTARRNAEPPRIRADGPPAVRDAKDALRLRYANGEITREEYLQGKVELED
jgi:uncharacterized membrane protein